MGNRSQRRKYSRTRRKSRRKLRRYGGDAETQQKFKKSTKKLRAISAFKDASDASLRRAYRSIQRTKGLDTNPFSLQSKYPWEELKKIGAKRPGTPPHRLIAAMDRDPDIIHTRRDERANHRRAFQEYIHRLGLSQGIRQISALTSVADAADAEQQRRITESFAHKKHSGGRKKRNRSNRRKRKRRSTRKHR